MNKIFLTAIVSTGFLIPLEVSAQNFQYPFQLSASSFQSYLNRVQWKDGVQRTFSNLNSCELDTVLEKRRIFVCEGYVTIQDPMGARVCMLLPASRSDFPHLKEYGVRYFTNVRDETTISFYLESSRQRPNCRWK